MLLFDNDSSFCFILFFNKKYERKNLLESFINFSKALISTNILHLRSVWLTSYVVSHICHCTRKSKLRVDMYLCFPAQVECTCFSPGHCLLWGSG